MTTFRTGQKVRIKESRKIPGQSINDEVFIVDKVITVDGYQKSLFVLLAGQSYNFEADRLEVVKERVEGKEIEPELIRKGDQIKAVQVIDDVTLYREGTVETVVYDSWADDYVLRSKEHVLISFSNSLGQFFYLLKSGPEPDEVREKLESLEIGQIIEYGYPSSKILARKTAEDRFVIYGAYGTKVYELSALRSLIGSTEFSVLSAV